MYLFLVKYTKFHIFHVYNSSTFLGRFINISALTENLKTWRAREQNMLACRQKRGQLKKKTATVSLVKSDTQPNKLLTFEK